MDDWPDGCVPGRSIDDEMLERVNRPVSGGSVASFGGSSLSGSLEWMV